MRRDVTHMAVAAVEVYAVIGNYLAAVTLRLLESPVQAAVYFRVNACGSRLR